MNRVFVHFTDASARGVLYKGGIWFLVTWHSRERCTLTMEVIHLTVVAPDYVVPTIEPLIRLEAARWCETHRPTFTDSQRLDLYNALEQAASAVVAAELKLKECQEEKARALAALESFDA
jgi:hypothetical protein